MNLLFNKRVQSSTTDRLHQCLWPRDRIQEAIPEDSIARSSFSIASRPLPTSLQWYRARRSVLCARRSWRFGDRCRFKKRELRGCHVLQVIFFRLVRWPRSFKKYIFLKRCVLTLLGHLKLVPDIDHFVKTRLFIFSETNRRLLVILILYQT
jgi:hypothetical protein